MLPYGYALGESGRDLERRAVDEELYERATALGERRPRARTPSASSPSEILRIPTSTDEARAIDEEAIETFTGARRRGRARTGHAAARHDLPCQGREAEATDWLERALVHANACGELVTRRMITQSLAMTLCDGPMPVGEAIVRCEELREANRDDRVLDAVIIALSGSSSPQWPGASTRRATTTAAAAGCSTRPTCVTPTRVVPGDRRLDEGAARRPRRRRAGAEGEVALLPRHAAAG